MRHRWPTTPKIVRCPINCCCHLHTLLHVMMLGVVAKVFLALQTDVALDILSFSCCVWTLYARLICSLLSMPSERACASLAFQTGTTMLLSKEQPNHPKQPHQHHRYQVLEDSKTSSLILKVMKDTLEENGSGTQTPSTLKWPSKVDERIFWHIAVHL